ncbi:unnamed protein product [Chrysoparadoxa australica]
MQLLMSHVCSFIHQGLATPAVLQPVDVLFYGYMCPRREVVYRQLKALAAAHNLNVVFASPTPGYDLGSLYGKQRDQMLSMSKVVLSMQFYGLSTVTTHRVAYLMAMGKAVVCESGSDEELNQEVAGAVALTTYDRLADTAAQLAQDSSRRFALEMAARAEAERVRDSHQPLEAALADLIGVLSQRQRTEHALKGQSTK